jgi:hypothetical protein
MTLDSFLISGLSGFALIRLVAIVVTLLLTWRPVQIALRVLLVALPFALLGLFLFDGDEREHRRRRHYDRAARWS